MHAVVLVPIYCTVTASHRHCKTEKSPSPAVSHLSILVYLWEERTTNLQRQQTSIQTGRRSGCPSMCMPLSVLQERKEDMLKSGTGNRWGTWSLKISHQPGFWKVRLNQKAVCSPKRSHLRHAPRGVVSQAGSVGGCSTVSFRKEKVTPCLNLLRPAWWRRLACLQSLHHALASRWQHCVLYSHVSASGEYYFLWLKLGASTEAFIYWELSFKRWPKEVYLVCTVSCLKGSCKRKREIVWFHVLGPFSMTQTQTHQRI